MRIGVPVAGMVDDQLWMVNLERGQEERHWRSLGVGIQHNVTFLNAFLSEISKKKYPYRFEYEKDGP